MVGGKTNQGRVRQSTTKTWISEALDFGSYGLPQSFNNFNLVSLYLRSVHTALQLRTQALAVAFFVSRDSQSVTHVELQNCVFLQA